MTIPNYAATPAADGRAARPVRHGRRARHHLGSATRHRVIFAGPVGVGKTTAVRALTDIESVDTEVPISTNAAADRSVPGKLTTTVGIDYGIWRPTKDLSVALVGTPGQDRFGTARTSLLAPHSRVVLWVFGDDPDLASSDVGSWLDAVANPIVHRHMAVAVTRTEDNAEAAKEALAPLLASHEVPTAPVLAVDPRERNDVMRVVCAALDLPEDPR